MEIGRLLPQTDESAKYSSREVRIQRAPEQIRMPGSGQSAKDLSVNLRAQEVIERQRLLASTLGLNAEQRGSLSNLISDVSQFRSYDHHSEVYEAWWGQLEDFVRQIQSTRGSR
jgi:hypothetical protein